MLALILTVLALRTDALASDRVRLTVHALEVRYREAHTLKAAFFERYTDGSGGIIAESGTVYFSRPGRMRWEYQSPQAKLFLVDGANAWFYVPADRTASRAKMKESADWRTPLALLVGKANLSELCRRIDLTPGGGDESVMSPADVLLRCIPKSNPPTPAVTFPYVLLETNPRVELVRVVIREAGNLETEFRFGNWEENVTIPEAKFHFQAPPGVIIVDQSELAPIR